MGIASVIISKQASDAKEEATFTSLTADVIKRVDEVEMYVDYTRSLNSSFGTNTAVIEAMKNFSATFDEIGKENSLDAVELSTAKTRLSRFYNRQFLTQLKEKSGVVINSDQLLPQSDAGIRAQYHYLVENDNPLGSKDELLTHNEATAYGRNHARYHGMFRTTLQAFGLYDIFLIEPTEGTIVYSVYKETDYATSLFNGPHRDSNLAEVARKAMSLGEGEVAIVDFARYTPSYKAPAAFLATPIYNGNNLIGVVAFQMPMDQITHIMGVAAGLGDTGESMIVGNDNLMRSQSRFSEENTILSTIIQSDATRLAFQQKMGVIMETQDGEEYLTAYSPMSIAGLEWSMLTRVTSKEALQSVQDLARTTYWVSGISAIVVSLFAFVLGQYLFNLLGGDPKDMRRIADAIAHGDLSDKPGDEQSRGAYAQLVSMRAKLRSVLHEANTIALTVKSGSNELSDGNRGLSERTEQQAANLEETGSSTEELTSTVKQNADNARSANDLAISTRERAMASGEVALRAVTAMQDISSASERIADIIGVIDEIAFQTNLLALNAAVEAARAGEQGRGFAVVASEVRQLAGRSASAAKEIKDLIEDSVSKVRDGTSLVTESGEELKLIVGSVSQLTDIVGQIAVATDEQAIGIDQINQALVHMDSVTQQNAALVQQAASTSRSMSEQATLLSSHIGYFSTSGSSGHSMPVSQPAPGMAAPTGLARAKTSALPWQSKKSNHSPENIAANHNVSNSTQAPKRASGSDEFWDEF